MKKSQEEIKSIISAHLNSAVGRDNDSVSTEREENLERYYSKQYGDEREGRSGVLTTECRDVVNWTVPSLMDIFLSTDKPVEYTAKLPQQEAQSEQATDYVAHVFYNENNGYKILREYAQDGLISKNGYIKAYWEDKEVTRKEKFTGLTDMAMMELEADPDAKIIEQEEYFENIETAEGLDSQVRLFDVEVERNFDESGLKYEVIPPERIYVDRNSPDIENVQFLAHFERKTRSDLIDAGYPKKLVETFPVYDSEKYNSEYQERLFGSGVSHTESTSNNLDESTQFVPIYECYLKIDEDGDGVAELRRITVVGDDASDILDDRVVDNIPIAPWCPYPDPHVWFGKSAVDVTRDLQRISTTALRGILDSMYFAQNPRYRVDGNDKIAIQDMMRNVPGGLVRAKPTTEITPLPTSPLPQQIADIYQDVIPDLVKKRTGVGIMDQGLSPDALSKTATEVLKVSQAGQQRLKMVAREMGNGLKRLFMISLDIMRKNQDMPKMVKLRNEWIEIDPTSWPEMNVDVNVGIGTGDKEKQLSDLNMILERQIQGLQIGMATPKNIMHTMSKSLALMGYKNADAYFTLPQPQAQEQQQPDPEMIKLEFEQQKHQDFITLESRKLDIAEGKAVSDAQLKQQSNETDVQKTEDNYELGKEGNQIDASKVQLDEMELTKEAELAEKEFKVTGRMDTDLGA